MLDANRISQDISRAQLEHRRLEQALIESENKSRKESRRIQEMKEDIAQLEKTLAEKGNELETAIRDFKRLDDTIVENRKKEQTYERQIETLRGNLERVQKQLEHDKKRKY